jgi:ribosomal protein L24
MKDFKRGDEVKAVSGAWKGDIGIIGTVFTASELAVIKINGMRHGVPIPLSCLRKLTKLDKALK